MKYNMSYVGGYSRNTEERRTGTLTCSPFRPATKVKGGLRCEEVILRG